MSEGQAFVRAILGEWDGAGEDEVRAEGGDGMSGKRVLDVGQCNLDHGNIRHLLHRHFTVDVVRAHSHQEALEHLRNEAFDLVLVNRVFDQTNESGIELIRTIKSDPKLADVRVMLVSNFPEAQDEAAAAGGIPGFGKSSLADPQTPQKLWHYLGP